MIISRDWIGHEFEVGTYRLAAQAVGLEIKCPKYREMGLIKASYEVFKNEGKLVLYCEHLQTVQYRDPSNWQD